MLGKVHDLNHNTIYYHPCFEDTCLDCGEAVRLTKFEVAPLSYQQEYSGYYCEWSEAQLEKEANKIGGEGDKRFDGFERWKECYSPENKPSEEDGGASPTNECEDGMVYMVNACSCPLGLDFEGHTVEWRCDENG